LGLLDRLSYGTSKEIPRGWEMTSLDADKIAQYRFAALEPPVQTNGLLSDNSHYETIDENNDPPQTSLSVTVNTDSPRREPQKKKRYVSLVAALTYRTRIDKKKREKGNNPYGKSGFPKCIHCRRRGRKVSPFCVQKVDCFTVCLLL
jgi:hypothetical protein